MEPKDNIQDAELVGEIDNYLTQQSAAENEGMTEPKKPHTKREVEEQSKKWEGWKKPAASIPFSASKWFWAQNKEGLQPKPETRPNRFPKIMESAKLLKPEANRILSFGCSYGEETTSLSSMFPDAKEIIGVDIDSWVIKEARRKNKNNNIYFHDELGGLGKFDLITCLMVLFCLEQKIPRERWEGAVKKLSNHINEDGLLIIFTSDYDPMEVLGDDYETLNSFMRIHNKNGKEYFNGYYRKRFTGLKSSN